MVTDIAPIHSLVSQVMQGVGEPFLLVPGARSPHGYSMKVSEARRVDQADLVFWVGEGLTPWLARSIETLGQDATSIELLDLKGLTLLPYGEEGHDDHEGHDEHAGHDDHDDHADHAEHDDHADHAEHDDDHSKEEDHDAHDHGAIDPHIWLDPQNAAVILDAVAQALSDQDPENAARYAENAAKSIAEIEGLTADLTALMLPAADKPYCGYHDAYRYFEGRFGLGRAIAVAGGHGQRPGARRLSEVRALLAETGARCVFSEVQFGDRAATAIIQGTDVRAAMLDPLGGESEPGPALYDDTLRRLARTLAECLS